MATTRMACLRRAFEYAGFRLGRAPTEPFGVDALHDLARLFGDRGPDVALDIGTDLGRTAERVARQFPAATVYTFEPVRQTFDRLRAAVAAFPRIRPVHIALGEAEGVARITLAHSSGQNSLLRAVTVEDEALTGPSEEVRVTTGAAFCAQHALETVDLIRTSADGYDLHVLRGCDSLLRQGRVRYILTECAFGRSTSDPHTSFFCLYDYLASRGFAFVTLYTASASCEGFQCGHALFASPVEAGWPIGRCRPLEAAIG